jgi:hypothetical protein
MLMARGIPRSLRLTVLLGWLIFVLGLLAFAFLYLRHGGSSVPKARWRSSWGQPHWVTFRDPLGQFVISHPSDWDESAPFERFTQRTIGSLMATDTVAIRHGRPVGLLVIIRYAAPQAMAPDQWLKLTRTDGPLKDEFGVKMLAREPVQFAGTKALKVVAEDTVKAETYRFESWFVPNGANALRITITAPANSFGEVEPRLRRMVASFRFKGEKPKPK